MLTPSDNPVPAVATWLGRTGLLPFIGLPIVIFMDHHHARLWGDMLATYALAIICFLVGVWWGLALIRRNGPALVMSNAVVLVAFFGHVLLPVTGFLLLCTVLFPFTVIAERRYALFKPQPAYYARLRLQLTLVATISMLIAVALL
jgi:hypothetical protein